MVDTVADCTTREIWALILDDLYPPSTRLRDVPINFRGMPWELYEKLSAARERTAAFHWFAKFGCPIDHTRIWAPADSYGVRGV